MNRDDVIRMAREAGFEQLGPDIEDWVCFTEEIERFAALVAAEIGIETHRRGYKSGLRDGAIAEREACAKVCEEMYRRDGFAEVECEAADECAAAIRARRKE